MSIKNPESLKEVKAVKLTDEIRDHVVGLAQDVEEEKANRSVWETKTEKLKRLRYGIRNKKTFPWKGAANFSVPLMDGDIARLKPAYAGLMNVYPIVHYMPYDGAADVDAGKKKEQLNDWRLRTQVKPTEQYNYGIDNALGDGATIYKVTWKFKTNRYYEFIDIDELDDEVKAALYDTRLTDDTIKTIIVEELGVNMDIDENVDEVDKAIQKFRNGESKIEMKLFEITDDHPQLTARSLYEDVIIPIDTIVNEDNLDDARFIDERMWMSINDIKIKMRDEEYENYDDETIEGWADKDDQKASTSVISDEQVLLHEVCGWYDIDDDGIEERVIITYPDANPTDVLRMIELPYDHNQFPYTLVKREWNDPGVYASRSISELDEDYQVGISTELNQTINNGTISNTPKVVYKKGSVSNIKNNRYIPGQNVELKPGASMADYKIEQSANLSQGVKLQIAQYLKGWANQRVGNLSSGISDTTNLPGQGGGGKKTAREINMTALLQNEVVSYDLIVWQAQMARVYKQIDALYDQFGSEEEFEIITGEKKETITRAEIQGKFDLIPNGRLDNTNPALRLSKAGMLYNAFNGDPMIDQHALREYLLDNMESSVGQKLLKSKEQLQKEGIQQIQQIMQKKQMDQEDFVQMQKIMNDLEIEKELVLTMFQGKPHSAKD